ncbi:MAG TPA: adenylate/guanylate cyclase domain-containing protein, partial [Stenomitos sp.]
MNCPSCQAPISPGTRFCGNCGSKLAASCPGCRHDNPAGSLYCESCGLPMAAATGPGDRRVVTVLFTDVSGFTAMSEKLDPEAVTSIVNRFFTVLTRPIYKYGGVVDKYIGDAIMAIFGAPVAHEDDPERALAAAWEMQEAARDFADNLEKKTGIRLKVRVGLNTGLVVAGAVGGAQKRDYTVLGDTVNLASKMEASARPGGILVSEETCRLTKHCWEFVELDPVVAPGRSRAVRVFEPRSPRGPEQLSVQERPEFIGREVELLKLELALEAAHSGTPQLALLVGEAGIGKSRLAREFIARSAMPKGWRVLRARCLSYQREVTYALTASLITDLVGPSEGPLDHARLTSWCEGQDSLQPDRDAELMGYFLGLAPRSAELKLLAPETLQGLATQTLTGYLLHPEAAPTMLSLNDLQWVDEASRGWLAAFIQALGLQAGQQHPFMLLAQYRPEGEGALPDDSLLAVTRLRIRPLSNEDGEALIRSFLDLKGPVEEQRFRQLLTEALQKAEGNPFYLCELIRSLTDSGLLVKE